MKSITLNFQKKLETSWYALAEETNQHVEDMILTSVAMEKISIAACQTKHRCRCDHLLEDVGLYVLQSVYGQENKDYKREKCNCSSCRVQGKLTCIKALEKMLSVVTWLGFPTHSRIQILHIILHSICQDRLHCPMSVSLSIKFH